MQLSVELIVGIAAALLVLLIVVVPRKRDGRTPSHRTTVPRGPANLRFICKGCSGQFTHSTRTIGAYEKGARSFFCNPCHLKWRETNPSNPTSPKAKNRVEPSLKKGGVGRPVGIPGGGGGFDTNIDRGKTKSGNGCLGATLLIVAIPITLITIAAKYA